MPIPAAHKRVSIQGVLTQASGGGSEIFEFTFADASALTLAATAAAADTVTRDQWASATHALGCSQQAGYNACRVEQIDATGKVTNSYYLASYNTIPGINTTLQCTVLTMALTLETGQLSSRGRKVRGRIFPPACAAGLTGSTTDLTDAGQYATAWAGYFSAMVTAGLAPSVASSTSAGLVPITGVSCDTVIDTQRRRKNSVTSQRTATYAA